jgi:hypothetical protein
VAAVCPQFRVLGNTTYEVYLNGKAFWSNIPSAVWEYTLGGYQVIIRN